MNRDNSIFKVYSVSCTWIPNLNSYLNVISFGDAKDLKEWSDVEGEMNHIIDEENFVHFRKEQENSPCTLNIKLTDSFCLITKISIVSEARIVEIYGKHGEYLGTSHAALLDIRDGLYFYNCQPDVCTTQEISIKFLGLRGSGMWLYGVKCLLNNNIPQTATNTNFDFNLIDKKLITSNIPVSERAEKFKQFLINYNSTKYSNQPVDPKSLFKIAEQECSSLSKQDQDLGKHLSHLMNNILKIDHLRINGEKKNGEEEKMKDKLVEDVLSETEDNKKYIKCYIDEGLKELERKLQDNFEKKLEQLEAKQNEKLDTILSLLKRSELAKS